MNETDAAILLSALTTIAIPFAHSWMKSKVLPDWVRFLLACALSAAGGYLSAIVGGKLITPLSIIQAGALISTLGAGIYITAFGRLGLERVLFPRADVIAEAQKSVAGQIGMMSKQTISDAVDSTSDTTISVTATPVTDIGASTGPVVPEG